MLRCSLLTPLRFPARTQTQYLDYALSVRPKCMTSNVSTLSPPGLTSSPSILRTSLSLTTIITSSNCSIRIRCSPDHTRLFHTTPELSASKRWQTRQSSDPFTRAAKVSGLKSRAAFKLLQINDRYRLFKPGQTVVDLGFAPGSWSQVAVDLTKPAGRVLGVDLIPAQPPRGVSTIQGDFLSPEVQAQVRAFVRDPERGRLRRPLILPVEEEGTGISKELIEETSGHGYVDSGRESVSSSQEEEGGTEGHEEQCVDVVLSDMCEPWDLIEGRHKRSISNPYYRMMNTSGNAFRDHAGSMVCLPTTSWTPVIYADTTAVGSVSIRAPIRLSNLEAWWALCLQVLCRSRGQSTGAEAESSILKGA